MSYSKIVLISGPSAAGKTTLSQYLLDHFAHEYEHVRQDDYLADPNTYPIHGQFRVWEAPENIMFDTLLAHIHMLKKGEEVTWRTFARDEYEPVHTYTIAPKPYILIDGSLLLTNSEIIAEADELIYLDVPLEVTLARRAERAKRWNLDLGEYDREVLVPAYMKYQFLKSYADHVIDSTRPTSEIAKEVQQIIHKKSFLEGI